jgi:DNA-3-methyladenine glycosylase I
MKNEFVVRDGISRCDWANTHPLLAAYHDQEWGTPLFDDDRLFEMLSLDCFQAGLSWLTILKKREAFIRAFSHFNIHEVSGFSPHVIPVLMQNPGIVRNRLKIPAIIDNARIALEVQKEFGSFSSYIWQFSEGKPIINRWKSQQEIPATSKVSDAMSRDMKKRGFRFAGSTICYAFMQSIGMVNDHLVSCFRHQALPGNARKF